MRPEYMSPGYMICKQLETEHSSYYLGWEAFDIKMKCLNNRWFSYPVRDGIVRDMTARQSEERANIGWQLYNKMSDCFQMKFKTSLFQIELDQSSAVNNAEGSFLNRPGTKTATNDRDDHAACSSDSLPCVISRFYSNNSRRSWNSHNNWIV